MLAQRLREEGERTRAALATDGQDEDPAVRVLRLRAELGAAQAASRAHKAAERQKREAEREAAREAKRAKA